MQLIPLAPLPAQTIAVSLGQQSCVLTVYTRLTGLYVDLTVGDRPIVTGRICQDRNALVRDAYLGFAGELYFADLQGTDDPTYEALGGRFVLVWVSPADSTGTPAVALG